MTGQDDNLLDRADRIYRSPVARIRTGPVKVPAIAGAFSEYTAEITPNSDGERSELIIEIFIGNKS
jgi:hypothetical protein